MSTVGRAVSNTKGACYASPSSWLASLIHYLPPPESLTTMSQSDGAPLLAPSGCSRNGSTVEPAVERSPRTSSALIRPDAIRRPLMKYGALAQHQHHDPPPHAEAHSNNNNDLIRDMTIGFADGLTVPFALTAGLSSLGSTKLVVIGGLAELFSGMISMGLGAYLAATTERQHWEAEYARESWEVDHCPDREREEIYEVLDKYGISRDGARGLVDELCVHTAKGKERWVQFMMDFELQLPEPDTTAAWKSAITMGLSYFVGGLVPMLPYFLMDSAQLALFVSIAITVVILLAFGYVKSWCVPRICELPAVDANNQSLQGHDSHQESWLLGRAANSSHRCGSGRHKLHHCPPLGFGRWLRLNSTIVSDMEFHRCCYVQRGMARKGTRGRVLAAVRGGSFRLVSLGIRITATLTSTAFRRGQRFLERSSLPGHLYCH